MRFRLNFRILIFKKLTTWKKKSKFWQNIFRRQFRCQTIHKTMRSLQKREIYCFLLCFYFLYQILQWNHHHHRLFAATALFVAEAFLADYPAMSFIFVRWQIKIQMQTSWVGLSTRAFPKVRMLKIKKSTLHWSCRKRKRSFSSCIGKSSSNVVLLTALQRKPFMGEM